MSYLLALIWHHRVSSIAKNTCLASCPVRVWLVDVKLPRPTIEGVFKQSDNTRIQFSLERSCDFFDGYFFELFPYGRHFSL